MSQALSKFATRGTAMVVTVSVVFVTLTMPVAIDFSCAMFERSWLYISLTNMSQYLNHSINGVLYLIVSTKLRKVLVKLICCKKSSHSHRDIVTLT